MSKFVVFYETAPEGLAKVRELYPAHQARWAAFRDNGTLLLIGPFVNPPDGAMGVFTTREAAEEFASGDPFVLNGVVSRWYIREWQEVLL